MAHFAEIDSSNKVVRVLVIDNEHENRGQEFLADDLGLGGTWIQTSYNANFRNKFAAVGDTYDPTTDQFIAKPLSEEDLAILEEGKRKEAARIAILSKLGLTEEEMKSFLP
jgi:hypothetical protein